MNWMVKHNKLDEHQLAVLDACLKNQTAPDWIRGYAGTGKSVLLIHALIEFRALHPTATACVVVFTRALKDMLASGIPSHLEGVPVVTYQAFRRRPRRYNLILVDEVQDIPPGILGMLKANSDKLIVAGDEEQTIYENQGVSVSQIQDILSPSCHALTVLYRLTGRLLNLVRSVLPNSRIFEARMGGTAVNVEVALAKATDTQEEMAWVLRESLKYAQAGEPAAILLPDKRLIQAVISHLCRTQGVPLPGFPTDQWDKPDFNPVNSHLSAHNLPLRYIGNGFGSLAESDSGPLVYLMTYHSAKGLDFETVFLPFLDQGVRFWRDDATLDRTLFFVACTRSRRNLFLSHHTPLPHPYVQAMDQEQLKKISCSPRDGKTPKQSALVF